MAIIDVIKYEGGDDVLLWKHPKEDFNTSAQLIVEDPWEAIVFSNGTPSQPYRNGKFSLETENIPFVRKLVEAVTGGVSPNRYRVFFINKEFSMPVKWGLESGLIVKEPEFGLPVHMQAFGKYSVRVSDERKLMTRLSGTITRLDEFTLKERFGGNITTAIKEQLKNLISEEKLSYKDLGGSQTSTARKAEPIIANCLLDYGLEIDSFSIDSITVVDDHYLAAVKEEEQRIRDAAKRIQEAKTQQEISGIEDETRAASVVSDAEAGKQADIKKSEAEKVDIVLTGQGVAGANTALGITEQDKMLHKEKLAAIHAMGQAGAAYGVPPMYASGSVGPISNPLASVLQDTVSSGITPTPLQKVEKQEKTCKICGAVISPNASFCGECGSPVESEELDKVQCSICGRMVKKKKFCEGCGARLELN